MNQHLKEQIRDQVAPLIESAFPPLSKPLLEVAKSRWMTSDKGNLITQLELMHSGNKGLLYCCASRDGSGPLKASFLTMLLLEDTIATSSSPFGICSGEASITVYRFLDLSDATSASLASMINNFHNMASVILLDYVDDTEFTDVISELDFA